MKIEVPKFFTLKHIEEFLSDISIYLEKVIKEEPDFTLDVSKIKKICLLGQLLLYKFISYTVENRCFDKPKILGINNEILKEQLGRSCFWELIDTYVKKPNNKRAIVKSYNNLKIVNEDDFLIAPQKLLRDDSSDSIELENTYLDKVLDFYNNTSKAHTICFCIAELFSNFWSHATKDSGTVMVARGDKTNIEICFADTGEGIINSFRCSDEKYKNETKQTLMKLALAKNITSKPNTNHLGLGLYMINCVVSQSSKNIFRIYSDTEEYIYDDKNRGVYKSISYWKGTITYLKLNLENLLTLDKIRELRTPAYNKIQWS
ncbi:MAG: hypothetical protein J6K96_06770 [Treponema sp.]|nr:hypothetical protein [Treponema sp.]